MRVRTLNLPAPLLGGQPRTGPFGAARSDESTASRRRALYGMAASHSLFGVVPILFTAIIVLFCIHGHIFAFDFHYAYWPAGHHVLAGSTPYVSPGAAAVSNNTAFIYPALAAILLAPFALLPLGLADGLFTALVIASALGTLRLLKVRDWRLYGLLLLWPPVIVAWQNANVTLLLVLGIACVWHWRAQPLVAGAITALLVSVKPFVWPLAIWLLATRRYAALAYALATGIAMNLAAWMILGSGEIARYTHLLSAITRTEQRDGYSVIAFALHLGSSTAFAYALSAILAVGAGAACIVVGRRDEDIQALALCVATTLLATPILWTHYFALMIVPLALARPRLSFLWLLPMAMLIAPETPPHNSQRVLVLLVGASVLGLASLKRADGSAPAALASHDAEAGRHRQAVLLSQHGARGPRG